MEAKNSVNRKTDEKNNKNSFAADEKHFSALQLMATIRAKKVVQRTYRKSFVGVVVRSFKDDCNRVLVYFQFFSLFDTFSMLKRRLIRIFKYREDFHLLSCFTTKLRSNLVSFKLMPIP